MMGGSSLVNVDGFIREPGSIVCWSDRLEEEKVGAGEKFATLPTDVVKGD